jgi:glutamate synthase domain-containing protein 1/glutamate synthase domain-containing protein 3
MKLVEGVTPGQPEAREGGCGVIGIVGTRPLEGRLIIRACHQMRNRGNGKGGGVAAAGLFAEHRHCYALHVAYLDRAARKEVEQEFVSTVFDIRHQEQQPTIDDHREAGLEVRPPTVWRYFVRAKPDGVTQFAMDSGIQQRSQAEDELVFQNSFRLNQKHYAGREHPRAFALSHGRDLMVLKGVGYAEEIARYYRLEKTKAHVWIGHQRYPTRGKVWHPGGAHPFAGLHEALVHNGDFANYHAVCQYLRQRGLVPLFVTDTEVSALLFDLYSRVMGYSLEQVVEALAPTPEGDFERLSKQRQRLYRAIQTAHLHGSPDGPWFFIVARCHPTSGAPQLIGITDVSMLRPQVFALQQGEASYAAIGSEQQAIDAFFQDLAATDGTVAPVADRYWSARGGSCTDGGAFAFTVQSPSALHVADKFGQAVTVAQGPVEPDGGGLSRGDTGILRAAAPSKATAALERDEIRELLCQGAWTKVSEAAATKAGTARWRRTLEDLTYLRDHRWNSAGQRLSAVLGALDTAIDRVLDELPQSNPLVQHLTRADAKAGALRQAEADADPGRTAGVTGDNTGPTLVIDARDFPPEGPDCVARLVVEAHRRGWRRFIIHRCRGDRFIGCGLGPNSRGTRIDVYGASGDYLGSGMDGAEVFVHASAQDQVGQILGSGRIVIFGDVGQTLLYGAKGGEVFVQGSAAGRPLVNAVGNIRAVINGTCLDYCAESFMAGDELDGGFVIINGLRFDGRGEVRGMELKYPGNNLFSLASGGACYLNDPYRTVNSQQLNGAEFVDFRQADWNVIRPYLLQNQELFGIQVRHDLLRVDGLLKWPKEVFRKVVASQAAGRLDWSSLPA